MGQTTDCKMRVQFYGVQGSGATFPTRSERLASREISESELLARVFQHLSERADADGVLRCTIEDILGGPPGRRTLLAYLRQFQLAVPRVYGGWTTCARVETSDDYDIVFDCGSGFRNCAKDLQAKWGQRPRRHLYLFGSHSHLDHTEGFDQAPICFDPRNTLHIYGNRQFLRALDSNLGIFTRQVADDVRGVQTPIFYAMMPAKFESCELRDAADGPTHAPDALAGQVRDLVEPIRLGGTLIRAFQVFHPAPCLAYRVEHGGKVFVFCTDHELRHGPDQTHPNQQASEAAERRAIEFSSGADLLYRDGQYFRAEYDGVQGVGTSGPVPRIDWGHSCIEDVVEMARNSGVKRLLIGHHDPNRDWSERNWVDETLTRDSSGGSTRSELARAETVIEL